MDKQVYTYDGFRSLVEALVAHGGTTGLKQSEARVYFTALNLKRMQRIDKTFIQSDILRRQISTLYAPQRWIVITEAWCGDSAQTLPVIHKIAASANGRIDLRVLLRDEHPGWIAKYHTDGSQSIPKLVAFDACGKELFTWGPRPQPAQQLLLDWKNNPDARTWEEFERDLHTWYARDRSQTIQSEFAQLISGAVTDCSQAHLVA